MQPSVHLLVLLLTKRAGQLDRLVLHFFQYKYSIVIYTCCHI